MRTRNSVQNNTFFKTVPFTTIFWETLRDSRLWVQPEQPDLWSLYTGKLLLKIEEQWDNVTFDLHPEKLYQKGPFESPYLQLQACFLKKFTHYDPFLPNHRHGIRLQFGQHLVHLLAESVDQFKRWFTLLRRFCIIDKFNRKYKLLGKLKFNDPVFGQTCYSCVRIQDAEYYIVKIVDKAQLVPQQKQNLFREISNLRKLGHAQILYFVELYEDEGHIYIVYEYFAGIDLRSYIKESPFYQNGGGQGGFGLDEKLLSEIIYGLLQALNHMHQRGIFHRDIKLDNLFIPERKRLPYLLITNFCFSEVWSGESQQFKKCGTPGFVAPEIFKSKNYSPKVDIFSLGVVFYILTFGRLPFEGKDQEEILRANERAEIDFKVEKKFCKKFSNSGLDLMKGLLNRDPAKRLSAASALTHHWFIKMETKKQQRNFLQPRGRSLSTIVENSVDITQSFYQTNSNSRGLTMSNKRTTEDRFDEDHIEKEFGSESLHEKLRSINSLMLLAAPSKKRH